jgi:hypothetical protein
MRAVVVSLALVSLLVIPVVAAADIVEGVDMPGHTAPVKPEDGPPIDRPLTQVFIDFDDVTAPCYFSQTGPLRDEYLALGVSFSGPYPNDGAAVLNECGNFGVAGHSAPNFLATNCNATMANGGLAQGPETMTFTQTIVSCSALVGAGTYAGYTLTMDAYDVNWQLVDSASIVLASTMQLMGVANPGIKYVVVGNTQPCVWVLDDLGFDTEFTPVDESSWSTIKALYR